MRRMCISSGTVASLIIALATSTEGQLIHQESFETNGDGTRYELFDSGSEFTGDSGPAMWAHNFEVDQIGLVQNAPANRAAILWGHTPFDDVFTPEAIGTFVSLADWAMGNKENANIAFFGGFEFSDGSRVVADALAAAGHTVDELFDPVDLPAPDDLDLLIHSSEIDTTALAEYEVPIISYNGSDHDDTAIVGIGATISFFDPVNLEVNPAAVGHPALGGQEGTIPWTTDLADMDGLGKTHNGGTVLATFEDPTTGEFAPGIFVVDEGNPLLGAFNPDPEGDGYIVGAGLNKFGTAGERTLTLNPIDVSDKNDVQMSVKLAATAADFENGDYLRIEIDPDGSGPEGFTILDEFFGVDAAFDPLNESGCLKGLSNGEAPGEVGDICLPSDSFLDVTYDIPDGATDLVIQFAALNTWGNEVVGIDDVRVFSGTLLPGDFNGNGALDAADLDLQAVGIQNGDLTFDLNGDNTTDILDRTFWIEELKRTWAGDANLDGEFNSQDFVVVFQTGKFEDAEPANATWVEGDWNGDLDFTTADFVYAFQGGGFEQGPRAAVNAVPEPASSVLILLATLLGVHAVRRRG